MSNKLTPSLSNPHSTQKDKKHIQIHHNHQILSLPVQMSQLGASSISQSHLHLRQARRRHPLLDQGSNFLSPNQSFYPRSLITLVGHLMGHTTSLHHLTTVGYNNAPLSSRRYSPFGTLTKRMSQHCWLSSATTAMSLGTGMPSVLVLTSHVLSLDDALLHLNTIITEELVCTPFDPSDTPLMNTNDNMRSSNPHTNTP